MKRVFDILLAVVLLPFAFILVVPAAILVMLESSGPGIFSQIRVGRHQQTFSIYKLRTMKLATEDRATHEISESQITRLGRILRRTKVDELPQIWNVLIGEMSFVGPRPCLSSQTQLVQAREKLGVFQLRPGITGLAQVAGVDMRDPDRLAQIDARYLHANSLGGDIALIVKTFRRKA